MSYSKGIFWLEDARIPFVDEGDIDFNSTQSGKVYGRNSLNESITERNTTHYTTQGRFTPNLLVCDDMLNDGDKGTNSRYYDLDLWFDKMVEAL
jgi:hypothetical protein